MSGGGLLALLIAETAFLGSHVLLSSTRWRGALRDQLGERGFLILYSLTAVVTLAWFAMAYRRAPAVPLWPTQRWMILVPVVIMPLATILLVGGYSTRNPTAVGMERSAAADDPAPGLLRVTRHPVMWAIALWALAHLFPNGDVASLMFFGGIAALALGGTLLIDRKKRLALGSHWPRLAQVTSNLPFVAILSGRTRPRWRDIGMLRLVAGLLLYAVLYLAHPLLTGVPVMFP
ncbi:MAG: NnrU family protein [Alphaproteobacteria bacterium]|nr:NnrU family protein [Alphaproteobacteria bacterium]